MNFPKVARYAPAAIAASTFLSWFTVPFLGAVQGYSTDTGLLLLVLSAIATVLAVKGKHLWSAGCSGAAGAWMVAYVAYLANQSTDFFGTSMGPLDFAGFGFWAAVLVPFVATVLSVIAHRRASQPDHVHSNENQVVTL